MSLRLFASFIFIQLSAVVKSDFSNLGSSVNCSANDATTVVQEFEIFALCGFLPVLVWAVFDSIVDYCTYDDITVGHDEVQLHIISK
jgi:hypothetical protein